MAKIHEMRVPAVLHIIKGVGKLEMQNVLSGIKENSTPKFIETHSRDCIQIFLC